MIKKGQKVHCILYGGKDGIVFEIHGEQHPETIKELGGGCMVMGGSASFDIVFEDHISRGIPESIVHGVQWRIYDEIATEDEIKAALAHAEEVGVEKEKKEMEATSQFQKELHELPGLFPYLLAKDKAPGFSEAALGAKNIKIELARVFPGVKFSVRSSQFSGGDSIDVGWTDGPTEKMVEEVIDKYQEGDFDGMEDLYNYRKNDSWPEVFGGAKYVSGHRHESEILIAKAAAELGIYALAFSAGRFPSITNLDQSKAQEIYRLARSIAV